MMISGSNNGCQCFSIFWKFVCVKNNYSLKTTAPLFWFSGVLFSVRSFWIISNKFFVGVIFSAFFENFLKISNNAGIRSEFYHSFALKFELRIPLANDDPFLNFRLTRFSTLSWAEKEMSTIQIVSISQFSVRHHWFEFLIPNFRCHS